MKNTHRRLLSTLSAVSAITFITSGCTGFNIAGSTVDPLGEPEGIKTNILEAGAAVLQPNAPADTLDIYLVGFHPIKNEPSHQLEAHHFCHQVNADFMQCVIFDGNTAKANLTGVEYIISERLFERLPQKEKSYWHPHNGEILSGQLVAPNLPEAADEALMRGKINSYGKTWHTWNTTQKNGNEQMPLGEPQLAWSFNRFGEARQELIESRDRRMGISTEERRRARQNLIPLTHPQAGVDALKGAFPGPTQPIPGVVDKNSAR